MMGTLPLLAAPSPTSPVLAARVGPGEPDRRLHLPSGAAFHHGIHSRSTCPNAPRAD